MDFSLLLQRTRTRHWDAPVPFKSVTSIKVGIFAGKKGFFLAFPEQIPASFGSTPASVGSKVQIDTRKCGEDEEGEESDIHI